jgi:hypothetical protein
LFSLSKIHGIGPFESLLRESGFLDNHNPLARFHI